MNAPTFTLADIGLVRAELARQQSAINAWHNANPLAVHEDVGAWLHKYPDLCVMVRRAADLAGWIEVVKSGREVRHTAREILA